MLAEKKETQTATQQLTAIPHTRRERNKVVKRYPGVQAEVSMRLGVRAATVANVWALRIESSRIRTALLEAYNRRIAEQQQSEVA